MFEKFSQSWALIKSSAEVLRADKELLLLPVLSSIAAIIVAASFFVPGLIFGLFEMEGGPIHIVLAFLFYLSQYFVIFFFNTALVGAAMIRLEGGDPSLKDGLRIAWDRKGAILGYAAIAAIVGMILKAMEERAGWIGRIVIGMIGMAWTVASFLVVPVIVAQNLGPIDAVKQSARMLKRSWGENIIGNVGLGVAFGLMHFLLILIAIVATIAAFMAATSLGFVVGALFVLAIILLSVIHAALSGIYAAAVYRFAADGQAPEGFNSDMMQSAFRPKEA